MEHTVAVFFYDNAFDLIYNDQRCVIKSRNNRKHWSFYEANYDYTDSEAFGHLRLK